MWRRPVENLQMHCMLVFFFFPSVSLSLFIVFLLIPSCKDIGESETK